MQPILKLVILGRDGILNRYRDDHVKSPQEWEPLPGALEAVARLNHAGWHAVVATNQSGIGRGMIDMAAVNAVHGQMMKRLWAVGGRIDAVFFCPHAPEEHCLCRKPLPGLMREIAARYGVSLSQVPMVADTVRDLTAARSAGCEPHFIRTGRASNLSDQDAQALASEVPGSTVHADLAAFADHMLLRDHVMPSGPGDLGR
ncbi:MAG: D-glycero-beta-D-manno-heptose 1,7-bisphosphate 7-phosphatase [Aquabacterium sp.]